MGGWKWVVGKVEHEFLNCHHGLSDLRAPESVETDWDDQVPGAKQFKSLLQQLVSDWGTGLEIALYEQAVCHFLLGTGEVVVYDDRRHPIGKQLMRLVAPNIAFKLTAFKALTDQFVDHAKRMIRHTDLHAIIWSNLNYDRIEFRTIV